VKASSPVQIPNNNKLMRWLIKSGGISLLKRQSLNVTTPYKQTANFPVLKKMSIGFGGLVAHICRNFITAVLKKYFCFVPFFRNTVP
jgi:hypothetical protein